MVPIALYVLGGGRLSDDFVLGPATAVSRLVPSYNWVSQYPSRLREKRSKEKTRKEKTRKEKKAVC